MEVDDGLTPARRRILDLMALRQWHTVQWLAAKSGVEPYTVFAILMALESRGYVRCDGYLPTHMQLWLKVDDVVMERVTKAFRS